MSTAHILSVVASTEPFAALHREAVALLPPGDGRRWLDVGCGPGLLTRLAAERGYRAIGLDSDPAMLEVARRDSEGFLPAGRGSIDYRQSDLFAPDPELLGSADVVSAGALLVVLDDPKAGLEALLKLVKPGGHLLLVETTEKMTSFGVMGQLDPSSIGLQDLGLVLWGAMRSGYAETIDFLRSYPFAGEVRKKPLLGGLVEAWVIAIE